MNNSYVSSKSPLKSMFSSVFNREDIKLKRGLTPNSSLKSDYSQNRTKESTPIKSVRINESHIKSSSYATPDTSFTKKSFYLHPQQENFEEKYSNSFIVKNESVKDMKYEDLQQKYDRMQEFYKNQIANLTKEVNHYKNLYHHILNNHGEDRKY